MQRCPCFLELQGALQELCKPRVYQLGLTQLCLFEKVLHSGLSSKQGLFAALSIRQIACLFAETSDATLPSLLHCEFRILRTRQGHRLGTHGKLAPPAKRPNTEGQVQESGCYCNSFLLVPLASCMLPTRLAAWSDEGNVTLQVLFGVVVVWSIIKAQVFCLLHLVTTMNSETSWSRFRQEWYPELLSEFAAWMYLKWTSGSVPHFFKTRDGSATEVPAQHFDLETHALFYCFDKTTCHSRTGLVFKIAPRK